MELELSDTAATESELTLLNSPPAALNDSSSPPAAGESEDQGEEQSGRAGWRCGPCSSDCDWKKILLTVCLWWAYFLINGAHSMIAPFFPNEAKAKGSSSGVTGVIVSASPFSVFVLSPVLGYLLPWVGIKFMLLSGIFLFFVSFVLLGFVTLLPSTWMFIVFAILLRISEGIGSALATTAALAFIPSLHPERINTLMGLFEVGGGLGFIVGPTLGGVLFHYGGFKVPFLVVGSLSLVPVIPCYFLIRASAQSIKPLSFRMMGKFMTSFVIVIIAISNVLSTAAISFFIPTLQPFLTKHFHLNSIQVALVFLAGPLAYMLVAFIVGLLADKLDAPRPFIVAGFLVFGIGYLFVGPASFISRPRLWITCVSFGAIGIGAALAVTPVYADILGMGKKRLGVDQDLESLTGVVSGIVSAAPSLGEFLGPLVGGLLTQFFTFQSSAVLVSEILLAKGLLILGVSLIDRAVTRHKSCPAQFKLNLLNRK